MRQFLLLFVFVFFVSLSYGQKVLQIEKFGSPSVERIESGSLLTYMVNDDGVWSQGYIRDMRVSQQIIELDDRFVRVDQITALRYKRAWPRQIGTQLAFFGIAWSGYALIGTLTDGDPETGYQASDAMVTGLATGIGLSLPLFIRDRTVRMGKRRRLRMLDLNF